MVRIFRLMLVLLYIYIYIYSTNIPPIMVINRIYETQNLLEVFHQPTLMHNFLYSLTICLLHYYPRHVSSINMSIFRRKNCIHTTSGIFALCKRLHSTLVESGLTSQSALILLMNKENCALKLVDEIILLKFYVATAW